MRPLCISLLILLVSFVGCSAPEAQMACAPTPVLCIELPAEMTPTPAVVVVLPADARACPFCTMTGIWTGKTRIINSQKWYVMKCTAGHHFLSRTL